MAWNRAPDDEEAARPDGEGPWHRRSVEAVLAALSVAPAQGLSEGEVGERLRRHGPNRLREAPRRGPWRVFLDQFRNLLILMLAVAAVVAASVGHFTDAAVILVVVVINAILGFRQEYQAERAMAALQGMLAPRAEVLRGGERRAVAAESLVPGDIVRVQAGDRIPADGRFIAAHGVQVDESALTGESTPVDKQIEPVDGEEVPLAERASMGYSNTVMTRGRGELVITATGMATETGRIAGLLAASEAEPTPLQVQLGALARRLAAVAVAVVALIFVAGLLRGQPLVELVLTSVALAVAAIPEGLPAVVTLTLALGMRRMARRHAIVKRLAAVETLGSTSVICSDKTGTLTLNQMTVQRVYSGGRRFSVSGEGYALDGDIRADDGGAPVSERLLEAVALCNDSRLDDGRVIGDPTEGGLLVLAAKGRVRREALESRLPRLNELPFDSGRKLMATFHQDGEGVRVVVKGAPEAVLGHCHLAPGERERLAEEGEAMARDGLRVLAVAERRLPAEGYDEGADPAGYLKGLEVLGLVGMLDPPRREARDAVARCRRAGVGVRMITGDHAVTATAIARRLGIEGETVSGAELDRMDDDTLAARIREIAVFARVAPEHKVRIVAALKAGGEVVAMTGDGVNDAPALRGADIGVAMGRAGTDVTREAAAMVLTDDNFATIVRAVEEGRTIYDNILKFVRFQLSTNIGAILTVAMAPLLGLPLPFNAVQILWVNIIMDGPPAMALGVDAPRPGIMEEPPRDPRERILTLRRLGLLLFYGSIMTVGTLGILHAHHGVLPEAQALTLAFTTFVLFQLFNAVNARAGTGIGTAFSRYLVTNIRLWGALAGVLALQLIVVQWPPAQAVFGTTALSAGQWGLAGAVAATVLLLEELRKLVLRRRRG
ncbi:calcium-translocating P-type ATPase, PMCA-type [Arhodomonas sp. SL1]|uniref:calcium-translocating P-type ATPase, PMCA-type n=1 Tax=Arhodomonas sp. SL1 TaxID=3425691 RepID=UPI003F884F38